MAKKNNFFLNAYKKNQKQTSINDQADQAQIKEKGAVNQENNDLKSLNQGQASSFSKIEERFQSFKSNAQNPLLGSNHLVSLSKKRLSAIYMLLSGIPHAAKIIKTLNNEELMKVGCEILNIEKVTVFELEQIEKYFGPVPLADKSSANLAQCKGDKEYLRLLLQEALGLNRGSECFLKILDSNKEKSFDFIEKLSDDQVKELLENETESIIATVLSLIQPQKAARVIARFPSSRAIIIIKKMSDQIEINAEALELIIKKIREKSVDLIQKNAFKISGKNKLIEILKNFDSDNSNRIVEDLKIHDPLLAEEIQEQIFTFNDIVNIPQKEFEKALKAFHDKEIAFLLKGATDSIKMIFFSCISKKRRKIIEEEIKYYGKVKKSEVQNKRKEFIHKLLSMENEGQIILKNSPDLYVE